MVTTDETIATESGAEKVEVVTATGAEDRSRKMPLIDCREEDEAVEMGAVMGVVGVAMDEEEAPEMVVEDGVRLIVEIACLETVVDEMITKIKNSCRWMMVAVEGVVVEAEAVADEAAVVRTVATNDLATISTMILDMTMVMDTTMAMVAAMMTDMAILCTVVEEEDEEGVDVVSKAVAVVVVVAIQARILEEQAMPQQTRMAQWMVAIKAAMQLGILLPWSKPLTVEAVADTDTLMVGEDVSVVEEEDVDVLTPAEPMLST